MRIAVAVVLSLLFVACQREGATPPPAAKKTPAPPRPADAKGAAITPVVQTPSPSFYTEKSRIGSELDKDGHVAADRDTFKRGDKISLTMWLKESPAALQTAAIWYRGEEKVHEERRNMKGEKIVTFTLSKRLAPGEYRVEGFWGGNVAAEHKFRVER